MTTFQAGDRVATTLTLSAAGQGFRKMKRGSQGTVKGWRAGPSKDHPGWLAVRFDDFGTQELRADLFKEAAR